MKTDKDERKAKPQDVKKSGEKMRKVLIFPSLHVPSISLRRVD